MNVIVTNAKSRIAYNVLKSLGSRGIDVITSDFVPSSMSFYSKLSNGNFIYPSPFNSPEKFVDVVIRNIKKNKTKVLVPISEETFLISKYKHQFEQFTKLVIPTYDQILFAHNKDKWKFLAEKLQVPIPKSYEVHMLKEGKFFSNIHYPVLIKPKQGGGSWGILQVDSENELRLILGLESYLGRPWDRFFVQDKIEGESHCVAMLFRHGECKAKVVYQQLRDFPVKGGQATLRVSIENPDAVACLQIMLEESAWHGICQADFIVEQKTGIPYLIDMNPRFWGSLSQGIASGVDFPYMVYKMAIEGDIATQLDYKLGVMTRWVGGDLRAFWPALRGEQDKLTFLKNFICPGKPVYYDDISFGDPIPFIVWGMNVLGRAVKNRTTEAVSHDSLNGVWE